MITGFFFVFLGVLLADLAAILPVAQPLPAGITNAIGAINGAISMIGFLFPFDTLFECLAVVITIEGGIFAFKLANWFLNKIRGSG